MLYGSSSLSGPVNRRKSMRQFICGPGEYKFQTHDPWSGDFDSWDEDRSDPEILPAVENALLQDDLAPNLAEYVDKQYKDKIRVIKPDFPVEFKLDDDPYRRAYIIWQVDADEDVPDEYIEDYILGQSSDGWGEGFEQTPIFEETDAEGVITSVFFSPWTPNAFCEEFN